jgi:hypothetical protein
MTLYTSKVNNLVQIDLVPNKALMREIIQENYDMPGGCRCSGISHADVLVI